MMKETIVGYAMYGGNISHEGIWLDRFMIDKHYQGKGMRNDSYL